VALYEAGNFADAAAIYRDWVDRHPEDPSGWYNLGNCHFSVADYGRALACYERAARLAPRDRDVKVNLDVTRAKLGLGGPYAASTPAMLAGWRDSLRPREWLTLAAVLWFLGCGVWGQAVWRRRRFHWASVVSLVLALACVYAAWAESHGHWRPGQAVAVANTALYLLPNAEPGAARGVTVPNGATLEVGEQRGDAWYRVRLADSEGWLPVSQVEMVWP
jgi:tetratricopeptide (TPR) repeat protein